MAASVIYSALHCLVRRAWHNKMLIISPFGGSYLRCKAHKGSLTAYISPQGGWEVKKDLALNYISQDANVLNRASTVRALAEEKVLQVSGTTHVTRREEFLLSEHARLRVTRPWVGLKSFRYFQGLVIVGDRKVIFSNSCFTAAILSFLLPHSRLEPQRYRESQMKMRPYCTLTIPFISPSDKKRWFPLRVCHSAYIAPL